MSKETGVDQADTLREKLAAERLRDGGGEKLGGGERGAGPLRLIAVTSGKGGVGKTNLTANLAVLAAKMGKRVLIIDGDLGLANVEIVFGLKATRHIGDLLEGTAKLDDVMLDGPHGIRILPGGSGVQSLTTLTHENKLRLMEVLEPLQDRFDVVLVDSSAGIGDNVLFFAGAVEEVLLLVSPEPTSIIDAYAVVKVLSQQAGVRHFDVVVNPVVDELPARDIFHKLTSVTSRFLNCNVRLLGYIPRDENLHRAIMAQTPITDLFPRSPASRAIAALAQRLFSTESPRQLQGGLRLMWQRLLREAEAP
jgi:flagellar biosynthesis protein FlhG